MQAVRVIAVRTKPNQNYEAIVLVLKDPTFVSTL
jgi:hypothetical protein